MNINLLNDLIEKVYVNKCHESFEKVLVDIYNIIEKAAHITHERYEDKILNEVEDIIQEISIKAYIDFTSISFIFENEQQVKDYILKTAMEVLEARS